MSKDETRFEVVHEEKKSLGMEVTRILRDRQTGVCYLQVLAAAGTSITPLLQADGRVVVQPG